MTPDIACALRRIGKGRYVLGGLNAASMRKLNEAFDGAKERPAQVTIWKEMTK